MKNIISVQNNNVVSLHNDPWVYIDDNTPLTKEAAAILSLDRWRIETAKAGWEDSNCGILLQPDDDPELDASMLAHVPIIALQFPTFLDGRAYSQANLLRSRYHYKGELRAVGDVLRDQLMLMHHCGFTSFALREDKSVEDALQGLAHYDLMYPRTALSPIPLFRRRFRTAQLKNS